MEWLTTNSEILRNLVSSGILFAAVIALKSILIRQIRRGAMTDTDFKKRWIANVRNLSLVLVIIGLTIVWASELQAFALSLVAVAAAVVIGTKELITCFLGGLLKATTKPFRVGDRIEINGFRGDVIDHNMLSTVLEQIGPGHHCQLYTGRKISLPNSLFLSHPVINEPILGSYQIHTFSVPVASDADVMKKRSLLLQAAEQVCRPFLEEAQKHVDHYDRFEGIDTPKVTPKIYLTVPEVDETHLVIRVPVPRKRPGKIEQMILENYFERLSELGLLTRSDDKPKEKSKT